MCNSNCTIRKALQSDLDEIKALADAHRHELGFVLRPALAESITRSELLVATDETGVIGFTDYRHRGDCQTTLYHIVVTTKWRRLGVGKSLIKTLQSEAIERGKQHILLKCPEDLPANGFYPRLGFELVRTEDGRGRRLNVWQLTFI